jgi:hypothetical protein
MRGPIIPRASAAAFIATVVLACAFGCSLFTQLDVDGYTPLDAGTQADVCVPLGDACLPVTFECTPAMPCEGGSECCLTWTSTSFRWACCAAGK